MSPPNSSVLISDNLKQVKMLPCFPIPGTHVLSPQPLCSIVAFEKGTKAGHRGKIPYWTLSTDDLEKII